VKSSVRVVTCLRSDCRPIDVTFVSRLPTFDSALYVIPSCRLDLSDFTVEKWPLHSTTVPSLTASYITN